MPDDPLAGIQIRPGTPADNEQLLALTRATPMAGRIALRIDRDPDFFALLRARGERHLLYVATHEDAIVGSLSAAIFRAYIGGKQENVAHIGDLKVLPQWSGKRLSLRLVAALEDHLRRDGIDLCFNLVADGNHKVIAIGEGRHGNPVHQLLGRFFVNELLPSPFRKRDPAYTIAAATSDDIPAIAAMLDSFARARNFARTATHAEVEQRIQTTASDPFTRILVARQHGRTVATLTVADTQHLRRNVPVGLPLSLRIALPILRLAFLPIRGLRIPRLGEPLAMLYIRHIGCAEHHKAALKPLISEARAIAFGRRATFLSIGLHERDPLRAAVAGLPGFTFTSRAMATSLLTPGRVAGLAEGVPFEDFALV